MDYCVHTTTQSSLQQNKHFLPKHQVDISGDQMTLTEPPSTAAAVDLVLVLTGCRLLVGVGRLDVRRDDALGSDILDSDYQRGGVGWHTANMSTLCTRKGKSQRWLRRRRLAGRRRAPSGNRRYCWCPHNDGHRSRQPSRGRRVGSQQHLQQGDV